MCVLSALVGRQEGFVTCAHCPIVPGLTAVTLLPSGAMDAFYDPMRSYEDNYLYGPFGPFAHEAPTRRSVGDGGSTWLGVSLGIPFGIPAGPLLNARFCAAALHWGYDIAVYKTVRTRAHASHGWPNAMAVHVDGPLTPAGEPQQVRADLDFSGVVSITNSFGVPSQDPDVWQPDLAAAVASAGDGQLVVASFQGTAWGDSARPEAAYLADHVLGARLVAQTGARVAELNLSCPNEGSSNLLCFDTPRVASIVDAVKQELGSIPLVIKLAFFGDDAALGRLIEATAGAVDCYAAINTIAARPVDANGRQALPGEGRQVSGVCGAAIAPAALDMVRRLAAHRDRLGLGFAIGGVGGVRSVDGYVSMRHAGADAVFSATGAMWDAGLAARVRAEANR